MYFAMFPPEVNSGRMYAGPGSESMVAAAEAWEELASELHTTAVAYQSVISGLTAGSWLGPSSAAMTAAAAAYVSWLSGAAARAEEAAIQATAAVAAYEEAFASTVPPQLVAANRTLFARLVASNLFGQYTSAIATTEAQYAEMWAQDTAAMYRYAASSAAATALTPFASARQNTDPNGSAMQATVVGQAAATSVGDVQNSVSSVQQTFSAVPSALQSLTTATPAALAATPPLSILSDLVSIFIDLPAGLADIYVGAPLAVLGLVALPFDIGGYGTGVHTDDIVSGWNGVEGWPGTGPAPVKEFPAPITNLPPGTLPPARVSAGLGQANTVGTMSVPATWTIATPMVRPISYTLPALPASGVADDGSTLGSSATFGQMALAGLAGRAIAGTLGGGAGKDGGNASGGERVPAAAGEAKDAQAAGTDDETAAPETTPRTVVTGVAAELREFAKLRDEGILTEEEYTEQKNRLLGR